MSKRRKSNFGEKVAAHAKTTKTSKFGYLDLPKGVNMLQLKEGVKTVNLDFLPYMVTDPKHPDRNEKLGLAIDGEPWYRRPFKVHKGIGVESNQSVVCPTSIGKKCPICEYVRNKLDNEGAEWDEVESIAAKKRSLFVVVPIDSEDHDEEIFVWDMSDFLFHDELVDHLKEKPEDGIFPDLYEGKTAEVKLKWKKFGKNKYPETGAIDFEDREAYDESVEEDIPNLDELLVISTYNEVRNIFFEEEDDDEDQGSYNEVEDEPEEKKKPLQRKPRKEEPEGEDELEQEDEPEEKPKLHRGGKKPGSKTPSRKPKDKEPEEDECPHGHEFGVDTEEKDECDTCVLWEACLDAKENN
jgi:hypothetical protein